VYSRAVRWLALLAVLAACSASPPPDASPPIRFLHTFGPEETELVNTLLQERNLSVESSLVPFARGQQVIREILRARTACPDLVRIDATWLPALVAEDLVQPTPPALAGLDWTPDAVALAAGHGVPQTVDGLVVLRDAAAPPPAGPSVRELADAARAARTPAIPHPLSVRVDGYWFVAWLRAEGGELAIDTGSGSAASEPLAGDGPVHALAEFAALFGDLAPSPPPAGGEAPDELRRWRAHELVYWVTGPWQLAALPDRSAIAVSPLAHAPRGGQLLVVPRCAPHPDAGWRLAGELTSPAVEQRLADAFGTIPTRTAVLASAPPLVRAVYAALGTAEPLRSSPLTPLLFDDLNPAIAAVVAGDATPDEAIAGVRRGWRRLVHGAPPPPASEEQQP
jgi:ABC-type glycerol-3-phosphate transport system substrate-binding protein